MSGNDQSKILPILQCVMPKTTKPVLFIKILIKVTQRNSNLKQWFGFIFDHSIWHSVQTKTLENFSLKTWRTCNFFFCLTENNLKCRKGNGFEL
jgi:hypothetical protein